MEAMSFWAPYSEDGVLDLSRRSCGGGGGAGVGVIVKAERLSPREACSAEPPSGYPAAADLPHRLRLASPGAGSPEPRAKPPPPPPRPFKAVTRALEADGPAAAVAGDARYGAFREAMLAAVRARNGGALCVSNPRMRRAVHRSPGRQHDGEYLVRRARNNAAAKKSRDLRRLKEDELAIRTAFLEADNRRLRAELDALQRQLTLLHSTHSTHSTPTTPGAIPTI